MNMSSVFARKLRMGRLAMPVWLVAAAGLATVAAAGQAVGPVLAGSITGTASISAQQALVLGGSSTVSATTDAIIVANDEGTSFTAGVEMYVGDTTVSLGIDLDNKANAQVLAILELNVPAGVDVDVTEGTGSTITEANIGKGTWLLKVPTTVSDGTVDLNVVIEPKDDAKPGFYTITGRIVQISG